MISYFFLLLRQGTLHSIILYIILFYSIQYYSIIISSEPDASANPLTINNPFPFPVPAKINIINPTNIIPQISGIYVDSVFVMNPKESRTFFVYFKKTGIKYPAELTIQQEFILPGKKKRKIYGGYTFVFTK